jgi:hypothetical protein
MVVRMEGRGKGQREKHGKGREELRERMDEPESRW